MSILEGSRIGGKKKRGAPERRIIMLRRMGSVARREGKQIDGFGRRRDERPFYPERPRLPALRLRLHEQGVGDRCEQLTVCLAQIGQGLLAVRILRLLQRRQGLLDLLCYFLDARILVLFERLALLLGERQEERKPRIELASRRARFPRTLSLARRRFRRRRRTLQAPC
jgi:hypothetical protein